jgi:hypothetical protein
MEDKNVVTYESVKDQTTEEYFKDNQFAIDAFKSKYILFEGETYVQFYGMDFTEGKGLKRLTALLTDYHYQDQADAWYDFEFHEGKITEKERDEAEVEYAERERVWEGIFKSGSRPNEVGLVYELCTKSDHWTITGRAFDMEGY